MRKFWGFSILLAVLVQLIGCAMEPEAENCLIEFGFTYNDQGHIEKITLDEEANGSVDARVEYTNTYTEDGWINKIETNCFRSDGRRKYKTIHELNESGRTEFSLYTGEETNVGIHVYGEPETEEQRNYSYTFEYDSNNRLLSQTLDLNADNTPDEQEFYTYNEDGDEETFGIDEGADGTVDLLTKYTYTFTAQGQRQSIVREEIGLITTVTEVTYAYDGEGNLIQRNTDVRHDGILEEQCTFSYGAEGQTDICQGYVNGAPVWKRTEQRDADRHVFTTLYEEFDDGSASRRIDTYNESGHRITRTYAKRDKFESPWRDTEHRTYTYDADGKKETMTRKMLNWGPHTETCADSYLPTALITERR